jgi:hypothetical protein
MVRGATLGFATIVVLIAAAVCSAQWETTREQPIVDGQSLAGIRLGETFENATQTLGLAPADISQEQLTSRTEHVYQLKASNDEWILTITATMTIGGAGIEAIHMTVLRRTPTITPYIGRTKKGYRPGESSERLRTLYGPPDAIFRNPATTYRDSGLVVSPEIEADYFASQIAIVRPGLSSAEVRRLVLP